MARTRPQSQSRFIPDDSGNALVVTVSPASAIRPTQSVYALFPKKLSGENPKQIVINSNENAKSKVLSPANVS